MTTVEQETTAHRAIETRYSGHLFRSRLEARWAAMFDLLGWLWCYEPIDGNGYIPDFRISGHHSFMVEIKPQVEAVGLCRAIPKVTAGLAGKWDGDILILGGEPCLHYTPVGPGAFMAGLLLSTTPTESPPPLEIGGYGLRYARWSAQDPHTGQSWGFYADGLDCGLQPHPTNNIDELVTYHDELHHLWGQAHEATRWTPR